MQESLTNVGRHAQAANVAISLTETGGWYVLTIRDDGRGLPTASGDGRTSAEFAAAGVGRGGRGMVGMRERAELLGGRFDVRPAEG
ncbi:ATP-binding protein, partial [Bacillus cereus group sp. BC6]|uniref:ATP-binding protein n=1 Tax=Bacillus cereus group sp. BC6 TaxID=3445284 RepID=UPI003F69F676